MDYNLSGCCRLKDSDIPVVSLLYSGFKTNMLINRSKINIFEINIITVSMQSNNNNELSELFYPHSLRIIGENAMQLTYHESYLEKAVYFFLRWIFIPVNLLAVILEYYLLKTGELAKNTNFVPVVHIMLIIFAIYLLHFRPIWMLIFGNDKITIVRKGLFKGYNDESYETKSFTQILLTIKFIKGGRMFEIFGDSSPEGRIVFWKMRMCDKTDIPKIKTTIERITGIKFKE